MRKFQHSLCFLHLFLLSLTAVNGHGSFQQAVWGSSTPSGYDQSAASLPPEGRNRGRGTPSSEEDHPPGTKWRGGWSQWSEWSVCSRPCDGGVSRQLRRCSSREGCRGEPVRYKICNMQPCPESQDFRARQCAAYDQVPYEGTIFSWAPHYEETEPCALTCRGTQQHHPQDAPPLIIGDADEEALVVVQLASRVQDGTRCRPGSLDMCINGKCQRVGCDLRIGSNRRVDECGVCGGDGSSCARPLYQWDSTPMSLCSVTCGGGYRMSRPVCRNRVSGNDVEEQLCNASQRPEPSVQQCNTHQCPPKWVVGQWGICSASCGGGSRSRRVQCAVVSPSDNTTAQVANEEACSGRRPRHLEPCAEQPCPRWLAGQWSGCSVSCGSGVQVRGVQCSGGDSSAASSSAGESGEEIGVGLGRGEHGCPNNGRPASQRPCSTGIVCPTYRESGVEDDIEDLIPGVVYHTQPLIQPYPPPQAKAEKLIGEQAVPSEATASNNGDPNIRVAPGAPGKTYTWREEGYTHCSASCLGGVQDLLIHCVRDDTQKRSSHYMCDQHTKPENRMRTCNDIPCPPRWNYSDFSTCSKSCGIGIQTREVSCIHEVTGGGANTVIVPNNMCPQPPPSDRQYCNVLDCPVRWHTTQWSKCTKSCGGGVKERKVECKQIMAQSHVVERLDALCGPKKPIASKPCNPKPCVLDTSTPNISISNTSYIQHDPKKDKVDLKVGGSATVFYGTQIKIKCPVKRFNRTKILWAKDKNFITKSKKFKLSKKGALRIQDLKFQDAGVYTCVAGQSTADLTLIVKQKPGEFPSSEEVERQRASPLDDPNDSVDRYAERNDGRYRPFTGGNGAEDQSHEQRPGDPSAIYKERERNKQRAKEKELERERERERQLKLLSTTQMPMRYYPQPDDDYGDREVGSGNNDDDGVVPSQMSVAGDLPRPSQTSSAARPMPHFLRLLSNLQMLWPFQTFSNSRGHRMISEMNYDLGTTENRSEDFTKEPFSTSNSQDDDERFSTIMSDEDIVNGSFTGTVGDYGDATDYEADTASTAGTSNSVSMESNSVFTDDQDYYTTVGEKVGGFRLSTLSDEDSTGSMTVLGKGKAENVIFDWIVTDWSKCSLTCGGAGFQMRAAQCMVRLENSTQNVESSLCEDAGLETPLTVQKCGMDQCPTWLAKDWSPCHKARCFDWNTAMQRRVVQCTGDGGVGVTPTLCDTTQRPPHRQECYNDKCKGVWRTDHWSECGGPCGEQGARYRILRCVWFGTKRPAGSACRHRPRPAVVRPCMAPPCQHMQTDCKDTSKFCQNVRAMNMCRVQRYQVQCCQSCRKH